MAEPFDPYRKWLGIPPSQQPPHHYRLLGIELYEDDPEVIDTAASQRMSYLQELGGGPYVKESQRLLNEVSAARRCLLDKARKTEYDAELRSKLNAAIPKPPEVVAAPPPVKGPTIKTPEAKAAPKSPAVNIAVRTDDDDDDTVTIKVSDLGITAASKGRTKTPSKTADVSKSSDVKKTAEVKQPSDAGKKAAAEPSPRKRRRDPKPLLIGMAVVVVGIAGSLGYVVLSRRSAETAYEQSQTSGYDDDDLVATAVLKPRTSPPPRPQAVAPPFPAATVATATTRSSKKDRKSSAASTSEPAAAKPASTVTFFAPVAPTPTATAVAAASTAATPSVPAAPATTPTGETPAAPPAVSPMPTASPDLSLFTTPDAVTGPAVRPHYAPPGVSLVDLQGGFRDGDEYHLFFNSFSGYRNSLATNWGHLVSTDLFTWTAAPHGKPPVEGKSLPKIGKPFIDRKNVSGLGKENEAPWLAPFTYVAADEKSKAALGLAVSVDRGLTWTAAAPKLSIDELGEIVRGPQLFRHDASQQWCLLYCTTADAAAAASSSKSRTTTPPPTAKKEDLTLTYRLLTSSDLKKWEKRQDIPFHAPTAATAELIELNGSKWILLHGSGRFRTVDFDGSKVTATSNSFTLQAGTGLVGFTALDEADGKSAAIISAFAAGDALAFPRRLQASGDGIVPSTPALPSSWMTGAVPVRKSDYVLTPEAPLLPEIDGNAFSLQLQAAAEGESRLEMKIFGTPVEFNFADKQYKIGDQESKPLSTPGVQLSANIDLHLVELMLNGVGTIGFKNGAGPGRNTPLELKSVGGPVQIKLISVAPLNPPKPPAVDKPAK